AIQYPIGAATHTAHGIGVAVLLPYVMGFNASACQAEFADIARVMGGPGSEPRERAAQAPTRVFNLFAEIGLPATIAELGVQPERLDWITEQSLLARRLVDNNPRPLGEHDVRAILANAFAGRGSFRGDGVSPDR